MMGIEHHASNLEGARERVELELLEEECLGGVAVVQAREEEGALAEEQQPFRPFLAAAYVAS